jgi:hypothetical protein
LCTGQRMKCWESWSPIGEEVGTPSRGARSRQNGGGWAAAAFHCGARRVYCVCE